MRKISTLFLSCVCLGVLFFSTSCSRKALVIKEFSQDDCPVSDASGYYDSLLVASVQKFNIDTTACSERLSKRFSKRAINIAKDLKVMPLLCDLQRLEENKASDLEVLKLKTELQSRITIGLADVAALLAEMECQKVRTHELQIHLNEWISKRLNRATVYSILAGGVTTIIGGMIATRVIKITEEDDLANITEQSIVMAGAIAGSYYSFRSMAVHKKAHFMHPRNHIACIFDRQNRQGLYSPFIWSFMNKPFQKDGKLTSGIEEILRKWHELGIPTSKEEANYEEKVKLFVGMGGDYEADELDNRIEMYDILNEEISLINYDLKRLQQEILIGAR